MNNSSTVTSTPKSFRGCKQHHSDPLQTSNSCRLCWLYVHDENYRKSWSASGDVEIPSTISARSPRQRWQSRTCQYLGKSTGETRECSSCANRKVAVPLLECNLHGHCTASMLIAGVSCCRICPDKSFVPVKIPVCYPSIKIRDLAYHIYPLKSGSGVWKRRLASVLSRIDLFNGKRLIICATGPETDSVQEVKQLTEPFGCEVLETPNQPALREMHTLPILLERLQSLDPTRALLFAHAKGVTRPFDAGNPCHIWSDILDETMLDYWPVVDIVLETHPLAGSFKKVGAGFSGSMSQWHYSGSYFWVRSQELFSKTDWQTKFDHDWWGVESYPSLHFHQEQAGTVFYEGTVPELNLYNMNYMVDKVLPALVEFRKTHAKHAHKRQW